MRWLQLRLGVGALGAMFDLLSVCASYACAGRVVEAFHWSNRAVPGHTSGSFLYILCFAVCVVMFSRLRGLYGPLLRRNGFDEQQAVLETSLLSGLTLCGTMFLVRGFSDARGQILFTVLFTWMFLAVRHAASRRIAYKRCLAGMETRNILIVGTGRAAQDLRTHLEARPHIGFRFKGFVNIGRAGADGVSQEAVSVASPAECLAIARSLFVDEILVTAPEDQAVVQALVNGAQSAHVDVRVIPELYDGLIWAAPLEYIGRFPTLSLHRLHWTPAAAHLKRILDVVLSVVVLTLCAPAMLLIALLIRLDSPGPVLYRAKRVGRKGRVFSCYKFRTMVPEADAMMASLADKNERQGILFKMVNDPRVTRVGRLLRKYSLDELPQFFNVLRRDMSVVGPRPPTVAEVARYKLSHLRRLDVLPGITGLWQVEARQDPSFESYIELDTAYIDNCSLWLDIRILLKTVSAVLNGTGA